MTLDDDLLSAKLDELAGRVPDRRDVLDALATFIRTAGDGDLVRVNPIRFSATAGPTRAGSATPQP